MPGSGFAGKFCAWDIPKPNNSARHKIKFDFIKIKKLVNG
ncbi:hypothetical protein JCM19302_166 [Jejuia pallidilutea]|uniref:Uncharacterized protein n=1 Tax=Jejuia pallidilutea TaxID=504487 RepID=A0A090WCU3_9FLAO|nr:hypothetical protein JCM19302_166 [Jejuia pallidilutea]